MLARAPSPPPQGRVRLLDIEVDRVDAAMLNAAVRRAIENGRQAVFANHNLHSIRLHRNHAEFRRFYSRADLIHVDGMPVIWIARLLGIELRGAHRTTYVDWFPQLMAMAADRGWRVFYCGSKPGIVARGLQVLRERFPTLKVRAAHGYLDAPECESSSEDVVAQINAFRPHLLFVGMGMPKQELWIERHREALDARVILPCGAAIDYIAGAVPTAPRWMGGVGLEWLFRLATEPRRLAHRYLVEPWSLVLPLLTEFATRRVLRVRSDS